MAQEISSGIIFLNSETEILLGKVPGWDQYDIPKGKVEQGESMLQAAIRETKEEVGVQVHEQDLVPLGLHSYRKGKQLALYLYIGPEIKRKVFMQGIKAIEEEKGFLREIESVEYVSMDVFAAKVRSRLCRTVFKAIASRLHAMDFSS